MIDPTYHFDPPSRVRAFLRIVWPPLPVWQKLDSAVLVMVLYSAAIGVVFTITGLDLPDWGGLLTVLNVVVLGILLQFRNRESYDRWWEARRQWGTLVNDSRNLCVKIAAIPSLSAADRVDAGRLIAGFAVALKNHLRGGVKPLQRVPGFETDPADAAHVPLELCRRTAALLRGWRAAGTLTDYDLLLLDPHARGQADVLGACERIKNTPLPQSYRALLKHGLVLYLLTSPWMVFDEIGWWGLPAMALLTYFLLGIELTAEDVEEPFGRDRDDLALNAFCETIRKSVVEVLGVPSEPQGVTKM